MEITIRHAEPDDYEAMHRIMTDPGVVAGTMQLPLQSAERWRRRLAEPPEGFHLLLAIVEGEAVGNVGIHTQLSRWRRRHVGEIGISVMGEWQGKGVGAELMRAALDLADNWLNITRIELKVHTDNSAAIALYEKFGFEIEGTHSRYAFRDGEFVDAHSMARVRG